MYEAQLFFNEIGCVLDDEQYRDVISVADMYHLYARQREVRGLLVLLHFLEIHHQILNIVQEIQANLSGIIRKS